MWKHFVLSTAIVAAIWLGSSVVTTTYLLWLDGSYEKSLQDNQATIDAAAASARTFGGFMPAGTWIHARIH